MIQLSQSKFCNIRIHIEIIKSIKLFRSSQSSQYKKEKYKFQYIQSGFTISNVHTYNNGGSMRSHLRRHCGGGQHEHTIYKTIKSYPLRCLLVEVWFGSASGTVVRDLWRVMVPPHWSRGKCICTILHK